MGLGRQHRLLNQNDARPSDLEVFKALGPVDAYLLQFSGAIWYPMVYDLPARAKHALGVAKRERQLDRSLRYIEEMGARFVFPIAGPPCFLDPELFDLNDIHGDESNIFPDQTVYLDWLAERGHDEARLLMPGFASATSARGGRAPGRSGHDLRRQDRVPAGLSGSVGCPRSRRRGRPGPTPRSTWSPS